MPELGRAARIGVAPEARGVSVTDLSRSMDGEPPRRAARERGLASLVSDAPYIATRPTARLLLALRCLRHRHSAMQSGIALVGEMLSLLPQKMFRGSLLWQASRDNQ